MTNGRTMRLFNDVEQIYQKGIVSPAYSSSGKYQCSVCEKFFSTETGAARHFAKQACYTIRNVFEGTITENQLYEIYKNLAKVAGDYCLSRVRFRSSRFYSITGKFFLYCYNNKVGDIGGYLEYLIMKEGGDNYFHILSLGQRDSVLRRYRLRRVKNPDLEAVQAFLRENEERVYSDPSFTLRSLERGDLTLSELEGRIDWDEFMNSLSDAETTRLELFLNTIG